jgi:hypothetical protein
VGTPEDPSLDSSENSQELKPNAAEKHLNRRYFGRGKTGFALAAATALIQLQLRKCGTYFGTENKEFIRFWGVRGI